MGLKCTGRGCGFHKPTWYILRVPISVFRAGSVNWATKSGAVLSSILQGNRGKRLGGDDSTSKQIAITRSFKPRCEIDKCPDRPVKARLSRPLNA